MSQVLHVLFKENLGHAKISTVNTISNSANTQKCVKLANSTVHQNCGFAPHESVDIILRSCNIQ